jgi:multidrug resistance efflux pump
MFIRLSLVLPLAAAVAVPAWLHATRAEMHGLSASAVTPTDVPLETTTVFANGIVEGRRKEVPLGFEITGRLASVSVEAGDAVTAGQVVAELDDSQLQIAVRSAEAELRQANAERDLLLAGAREEARRSARAVARVAYEEMLATRTALERTTKLASRRAATQQELDDREAAFNKARAEYQARLATVEQVEADARAEELSVAEARIAAAKVRIEQAEDMLQKATLVAPLDGVVLRRDAEPGQLVTADTRRPLLVVADTSQRRVRAYVEELDALQISLGSPAQVAVDGLPGTRLHGSVVRCAPGMIPKPQLRNRPGERSDVRVREVVVQLDHDPLAHRLVMGLPVDVYLPRSVEPADATTAHDQTAATALLR